MGLGDFLFGIIATYWHPTGGVFAMLPSGGDQQSAIGVALNQFQGPMDAQLVALANQIVVGRLQAPQPLLQRFSSQLQANADLFTVLCQVIQIATKIPVAAFKPNVSILAQRAHDPNAQALLFNLAQMVLLAATGIRSRIQLKDVVSDKPVNVQLGAFDFSIQDVAAAERKMTRPASPAVVHWSSPAKLPNLIRPAIEAMLHAATPGIEIDVAPTGGPTSVNWVGQRLRVELNERAVEEEKRFRKDQRGPGEGTLSYELERQLRNLEIRPTQDVSDRIAVVRDLWNHRFEILTPLPPIDGEVSEEAAVWTLSRFIPALQNWELTYLMRIPPSRARIGDDATEWLPLSGIYFVDAGRYRSCIKGSTTREKIRIVEHAFLRADTLELLAHVVREAIGIEDDAIAKSFLLDIRRIFETVQSERTIDEPRLIRSWPTFLAHALAELDYDEPAYLRDLRRLLRIMEDTPEEQEAFLISFAHQLARRIRVLVQNSKITGLLDPDKPEYALFRRRTENTLDYVIKPITLNAIAPFYAKQKSLALLSAMANLLQADIETTFDAGTLQMTIPELSQILDEGVRVAALRNAKRIYPRDVRDELRTFFHWLERNRLMIQDDLKAFPDLAMSLSEGNSPIGHADLSSDYLMLRLLLFNLSPEGAVLDALEQFEMPTRDKATTHALRAVDENPDGTRPEQDAQTNVQELINRLGSKVQGLEGANPFTTIERAVGPQHASQIFKRWLEGKSA